MKSILIALLLTAGCALAGVALADDAAAPQAPAATQAPASGMAPAYLIIPTHPNDTLVPFFDVKKCDDAAKSMQTAYKAVCLHLQ